MEPMATTNQPEEKFFIESALKHWPYLMLFASIVAGWAHFQANLADYGKALADTEARVSAVETTTQTANVNYATLAGKIDTVNANINILLKANHLQ